METIRVLENTEIDKNRQLVLWNAKEKKLSTATSQTVLLEALLCYGRLLNYEKSSCGVHL